MILDTNTRRSRIQRHHYTYLASQHKRHTPCLHTTTPYHRLELKNIMKVAKRKRTSIERAEGAESAVTSRVDFQQGRPKTADAHHSAEPGNVDATATRRRKKNKRKKKKNSEGNQRDIIASEREPKAVTEASSKCANPPMLPAFPYETDADDHCESPLQAYQHVVPLLSDLGKGKEVKIYDPYFCNGAVKRNLGNLGFANVYNVMEDCYSVWEKRHSLDFFDALVTNPPYSGDHVSSCIPRCCCFCREFPL